MKQGRETPRSTRSPALARALYTIGNLARRRERWLMARRAFGWSARMNPASALAWWQYGRALRRLGHVDEGRASLERAFALDPTSHSIAVALAEARPRGPVPDRIGFVALGTTGLCNASCIHCPTGKESTAHVPRVPMAMPLFHKIIDEIADLRMPVTGQFAFGLFGDALVDPHVVERARYLRDRFPSTPISINTNGAAFNVRRHAVLRDANVVIGLHCESIVTESFNSLMHPLRLERLIFKYEQILDIFAGRVRVAVPLNRRNLADAAETRAWFEQRGGEVAFSPMASRCAEDRSVFEALAFRPVQMRCSTAILDDLVIDCDGMVLRCCQDFHRAEPIGSVAEQPLREIVFGASRRAHAAMLDEGRHLESATCSRCFADCVEELEPYIPRRNG